VRDGHYDGLADDLETEKMRRVSHLHDIQRKIGLDGANAACQGVLPAVNASVENAGNVELTLLKDCAIVVP
jgi:hypothetical protein